MEPDKNNQQNTTLTPTKLFSALKIRFQWVVAIILTFSILAFAGTYWFYFELINSFRYYYFLAALPLLLIALYFRDKKFALLIVLSAIINLTQIYPSYSSKSNQVKNKPQKLLIYNVHTRNQKHQQLLNYINEHKPDTIALVEINRHWHQILTENLASIYPYQIAQPREDNFGILLMSKNDFSGEIIQTETQVPIIKAKFADYQLLVIHPIPPLSQIAMEARNELIESLSTFTDHTNTIICGDFNAVSWSTPITQLQKRSHLKNCADGYGILSTWPANLPLPGIPIDHCLISQSGSIHNFERGHNIGSDHYPLIIQFSFETLTEFSHPE